MIVLISFLGSVSLVFAQTLPNPLGNVGDFPTLINNIVIYVSGVIGGLAVIMFVWAGILFLTSAGNEGQLTKARKALLYAVIGLAIALVGGGLITFIKNIIGG